ncbi:MAG: PaaI family thioesterase [Acidobacteriota bacterium]
MHDLLGFSMLERETGHVVLAAEVRADLKNRRGVLHGGVVSALLDSALGGAVVAGIDPEEWCATLQLSVQFVSGARHGPLRADGRLIRRTRQCAFARGEVHDAAGQLVATGQGTWHIWPGRPAGA